ncbi:antibiotic biosynthesis monooxygenase family protein [Frankia sp. Cppng1_Ct_nod]|uniref:antibiotic biosynthesis monooxygenase family protein n=1 Tax=Frankia sp. Cppng1_Ct_nod TaxID=2897162 RepID=UPI00104154CE|nr:antibiotic biosynthesis monooxygenase family protein [Frankia sp. Cppng1_Ct_nod]
MTAADDHRHTSPALEVAVLEVARFDITPGEEEKFADAYHGVVGELVTCPGCLSVRMTRGVETPSRFILLVEWENLDAHLVNFRESDRFTRWRAALGSFFAQPPTVEHATAVEHVTRLP